MISWVEFREAIQRDRVDGAAAGPALLALSVDRFRLVNDTFGYVEGAELLATVLERVLQVVGAGAPVTRIGREEFAVLLPATPVDGAIAAAQALVEAVRAPITVRGGAVFVTASVGVATVDTAGGGQRDDSDPLCHAEVAMHQAERGGGDQYAVFEPGMRAARRARLALESDLHQAVRRGEFVVFYQPVMTVTHRRVHGFEALVRWRHPERGLVPPGEFIPVAEETGMIVAIGRGVLAQACAQLGQWQRQFAVRPPLTMSVNLSARQLRHPDLVAEVRSAIEAARIDSGQLILEITETSLHDDVASSIARLTELKELGVQLAIDDFGTGYSSLSFLQQFPVDVLKIDRSFISGMTAGRQAAAFTRAIVGLGRTLKLHTVAEGVETAEQLAGVRRAGSEFAQGYHFARPLAAADAEGYLRASGAVATERGELAG